MSTAFNVNSLTSSLTTQLDALAAAQGPFPTALSLPVPSSAAGGVAATWHCDVVHVDRVGISLSRMAFENPLLGSVTIEELQDRSRKLANQLTYLLEPIQLIEIDSESCAVQLRSNPPSRDSRGTSYYEIFAQRGGQFELCRYRKQTGDTRQRIDIEVTREVLQRLARDFAAA